MTSLSGLDMVVYAAEDGKMMMRNVSCAKKLQRPGGTVGAEKQQSEP